MAERKWSALWVVGLLVCMGLGWHVWRTRSQPEPEASRWDWPREELTYVPGAEDRPGLEEEEALEEALAEEDDGRMWGYADRNGVDLGGEDWEVDLGRGGRLLWIPDLALRGPWRDGKRPLPGEVGLFEEPLPGGLCYPGLSWLLLELHKNSFMGLGEAHVIGNNPKLMEALLRKFKSAYFHTPELDLYGPRDPKQKGKKPVSSRSSGPPKRAEVSVKMKVLTLCAGLSASACAAVQVRQVDTEWLEDCPKEARVAIEALGLGTGEPYDVGLELDYTRRQETPLFMKEGPVVARWEGLHLGPDFPRSELGRRMKGAKLYGRAKSYGHRMSVQFNRLELADGRKLPICAIGYDVWGKEPGLDRWGPGSHPGVRVGNENPKKLAALAELLPGEFPIAVSTIWISFGMPFRAEWLARR
jgi:hypothetical protein